MGHYVLRDRKILLTGAHELFPGDGIRGCRFVFELWGASMERRQDTDQMLAIVLERKYPYSGHLFDQLEAACKEVTEQSGGHGRIILDAQGLNICGKILVKFIDIHRRFFMKDPGKSKKIP